MLTLDRYLADLPSRPSAQDLRATLIELASAAKMVHSAIRSGAVPAGATETSANASGETQKPLDVYADEIFLAATRAAPVALYGSEEQDEPVPTGEGSLAIAIDPLDGSSNIETNIAVGTIFSIFAVPAGASADHAFAQSGTDQLAAGFFVYGAQLLLVFTAGSGTESFIHDPQSNTFRHYGRCQIPEKAKEYAVNASNRRHWHSGMHDYIADLERGADGPRQTDFGMRYTGSLVADCYRILQRGGVFIYPADRRAGYEKGRLRQLYEANPIAFCIEQAGGWATDMTRRLLDIPATTLHAKIPLAFGSSDEIRVLGTYVDAQGQSSHDQDRKRTDA